MAQTFREKYEACKTWQEKVMVMEIFHMASKMKDCRWTLSMTAEIFNVSVGLVSENLRLADALHRQPKLMKVETRADALNKIGEMR